MLPLDSDRWRTLETYLGDPASIPATILELRGAVGSPAEASSWAAVRDFFLHQFTIKPRTAFVVLPYAVAELVRVDPARRVPFLVDVGITEWARRCLQDPDVPDDSDPAAYHAAIGQCHKMATASLTAEVDPADWRYLTAAVSCFAGHTDFATLLFQLDGLYGTCPKCGETGVYPRALEGSTYV